MNSSRREILQFGGAALATAALSLAGFARAQVKEEAEIHTDSTMMSVR